MKKKNIYISLASALVVLFSSCSKDFLNTPSPNLAGDTYFSSDEAAITALVGVYNPLARYESTQIGEWMIGDVVSDDAEKGGEGPGDVPDGQDLKDFRANPENSILSNRWTEPYVGINRANKIIEGVEGNELISEDVRNQIVGEAKFLRAMYHFNLAKVFGPIPVVTKILNPDEFTKPRDPLSVVYAQIEKDLVDAISLLPEEQTVGRANKWVAKAFLTKIYVFEASDGYNKEIGVDANEYWKKAADMSNDIIINGPYWLDDYTTIFTSEGENYAGSIFEIQYQFIPGDDSWGDENAGTVTSIFQGSRQLYDDEGEIVDGWGWGFDLPTQNLVDEYETGDLRKDATIIDDHTIVFAGTDDEEEICTQHINGIGYSQKVYHSLKYYIPASERNDMSDSPNNWRLIRFADVLLWNAEANVHIGGDWQTPLNNVRDRAGLMPTTETDGLKAVYHERRVELAMEGHRYWDLIRTGRGNLMKGYSDNKKYMPIPQSQIALNPNLKQNPY